MTDLDKQKITPEQEAWENSPEDATSTLEYLRILCAEKDAETGKMVLSKSWAHLENNQEFLDALLQEDTFLPLLQHLQLLTWKGDPENSKDGLGAVLGFILQGNIMAAEESLNILLDASDAPMEVLAQVQADRQFSPVLTFCTQRAIQYNARNSIKKRNAEKLGDGYTRDGKYV